MTREFVVICREGDNPLLEDYFSLIEHPEWLNETLYPGFKGCRFGCRQIAASNKQSLFSGEGMVTALSYIVEGGGEVEIPGRNISDTTIHEHLGTCRLHMRGMRSGMEYTTNLVVEIVHSDHFSL